MAGVASRSDVTPVPAGTCPRDVAPLSAARPAVLITGGAKRIGGVLVRAFAAHGWHVVIHCGHSRAQADALAALLTGGQAPYEGTRALTRLTLTGRGGALDLAAFGDLSARSGDD